MKIFYRVLRRDQRLTARRFARESYIEADGDIEKAKLLFRSKLEGYGNILTMLTVVAIMVQIAYTLFKFWKDTHVAIPPEEPTIYEPIQY